MSIVNFWSSGFRLLSQCLKEIESLCAAFLWSGPELKTSKAKIAWSDVCMPKAEGGLGLRRLKEVNLVNSLKLIWHLLSGQSMWSSWIREYLLVGKTFWEVGMRGNKGSWMWKKLIKLRSI